MPNLTPTSGYANVYYGPVSSQRMAVLKHPVTDPGGNPCILWRHGGGFAANDFRMPFIANHRGNAFFHYLSNVKRAPSDAHFTCISYMGRQGRWTTSETTHPDNDTIGWFSEPDTIQGYYPETYEDTKSAILYVKQNAKALNIDPDKVFVGGSSAGAMQAFWSQVTTPRTSNGVGGETHQYLFGGSGSFDTRCRGVVAQVMPIETRRCTLRVRNCNWTAATKTISFTASSIPTAAQNPFGIATGHKYEPAIQGTVVRLDGPGVTAANYVVSSVTYGDGTNTMVLTTDILNAAGATAGDLTGTFNITLANEVENALAATWQALYGTFNSTDLWAVPDSVRAATSALDYIERRATQWLCPVFLAYETYSVTDFQPFDTDHEGKQFDIIMEAARRFGCADKFTGNRAIGTWADNTADGGVSASEEVYQFLVRCLSRGPLTPAQAGLTVGARGV